jgi:hypothetical protein
MISSNDHFYSQKLFILDEFDKNHWRNWVDKIMVVSFRLLFNTGVSFVLRLEEENEYLVYLLIKCRGVYF